MKVRVLDVIERDDHAILFGGEDEKGQRVTFHMRMPGATRLDNLLAIGTPVEVEIPHHV